MDTVRFSVMFCLGLLDSVRTGNGFWVAQELAFQTRQKKLADFSVVLAVIRIESAVYGT